MIILENYRKNAGRSYNSCRCSMCGIEFDRRSDYTSFANCIKCSNKKRGLEIRTHGHNNKNSRLHVTWSNMKRRCDDKSNKKYHAYGGAGIKVCDEWLNFECFMDWAMSNGYSHRLTIDRIENSRGYEPSNCRFVDISTQNANKSITNKNKTGYIGVRAYGEKFTAQIQWRGKAKYLGCFELKINAAHARDQYIIENHLPHTLNFKKGIKDV